MPEIALPESRHHIQDDDQRIVQIDHRTHLHEKGRTGRFSPSTFGYPPDRRLREATCPLPGGASPKRLPPPCQPLDVAPATEPHRARQWRFTYATRLTTTRVLPNTARPPQLTVRSMRAVAAPASTSATVAMMSTSAPSSGSTTTGRVKRVS